MIRLFILALFAAIIVGCDVTAQTQPPHRITWTNASPGIVVGYNVYCGPATGQYEQNWNIGGAENTEIIITSMGLDDGMHYCVVTAYNWVGESPYSNEVSFATMSGDLQQQKPVPPVNLRVD